MMLTCVIFDMDGTLIDSEKFYLEGFKHAFAEYGFLLSADEIKVFVGMSGESEMLEIDKITHNRDITNQIFNDMLTFAKKELTNQMVPLKPYARELLTHCQNLGLKIGLATSTYEASGLKTLKETDLLHFFDFLVFGNEVTVPKPNKMIYELALKKANASTGECLVVEDSHSGVVAATSGNLAVAQLIDDIPAHNMSTYTVNSLKELMPLINTLLL